MSSIMSFVNKFAISIQQSYYEFPIDLLNLELIYIIVLKRSKRTRRDWFKRHMSRIYK